MKKTLVTLISVILIFSSIFFVGCKNNGDEDFQEKVESKVLAYRTDLEDSIETLNTDEKVMDYLVNWAKSKNIDYSVDRGNNIIMKVPASESYKDATPTVIVCNYDASNIRALINPIATALYVVKNSEDTGNLAVIFTRNSGNNFSGIKELDSSIFTDDTNVFCLSDGMKGTMAFKTAYMNSYCFSSPIEYTTPEELTAYKISISGLKGGTPDLKISSYPNPIKELGEILANFKTTAKIFELAEISGGTSGNLYPDRAEMTIVIDENYINKFEKKMEKSITKYIDKYGKKYPDLEYTCEPVELPEKVLTKSSQNTFVSSIYTLLDGTYERSDDSEITAITNLGKLSLDDNCFSIDACGASLQEDTLSEIDNDFANICGISGIDYKKTASFPAWSAEENSPFYNCIAKAYKEYTGDNPEYIHSLECSNAAFIKEYNQKTGIVTVTVTEKTADKYAGTIINYMKSLTHIDNTK